MPLWLSITVTVDGLLVTSVVSVLAICVSAQRTPYARLRGHALGVLLFLLFPALGFLTYLRPPSALPSPYSATEPLGLSIFLEHALITTGLLGSTIGFSFLTFALLVVALRYRLR